MIENLNNMKQQFNLKRIVLLGLLGVFAMSVPAQNQVKGKVLDADGTTPLLGVTVKQVGATGGTITDMDGNFTIDVTGKEPVLRFTYIGYDAQQVRVGNKRRLTIYMKEDAKTLKDVVVTALGIKREEKSLGYSVSKVTGDDLNKTVSGNWMGGMKGKVAGLSMLDAGTGPLNTMRVTLRGDHSLNYGNSQALFVVDGVPISSATVSTGSGSTYANQDAPVDFGNGAGDINPEDIESVTVLKGAAATALYGSMAGNGAIVITTKGGSGKKGWGVTVNSSVTFEKAGYWPDFQKTYGPGSDMGLSPFSFWDLTAEQTPDGAPVSAHFSRYAFGEKYDASKLRYQYLSKDWDNDTYTPLPWKYNEDWYKGFFQTGTTYRNNVTVSGGNGKGTTARVSLTDTRNDWIMPNTGYVSDAVALAFDSPISKNVSVSSRVNFLNKRSNNLPATGYSSQNPIYALVMGYTNQSATVWKDEYFAGRYNEENYLAGGAGGKSLVYRSDQPLNPYRNVYEELNALNKNRVYGNVSLNVKLAKGLSLKLRSALDLTDQWRTQQKPFYTSGHLQGFYREQVNRIYHINNDFRLNYVNNKLVGDRLGFSISLGGNSMNYKYYNNRVTLEKLQNDGVYNVYNVPSGYSPDVFSYHSKKKVNSFYGFASLSWDNTYYLEVTDRNDWSSTLSAGNRSYNYPSVSTGILLDKVFHLDTTAKWVDMLKLKLSWANVGTDTSPYALDRYYNATSYYGGYTISPTIPDAKIKPENEESWEGGLEGKLFGGRVSFDFTIYSTSTTNQIVNVAADQITGATGYTINAGEITSKGIELTLGFTPVRTRDWEWNVNVNWSKNWNRLERLQDGWDPQTPYQTDMGTTIGSRVYVYSYLGKEMYHLYGAGYKRAPEGSYYLDEQGNKVDCSGMKVVDKQGYPILDRSNLKDLGKVNPDWTGGLNTHIRYKNWNLSMAFSGQYGGHCYSVTNFALSYQGKLKNSLKGRYDGMVVDGVQATGEEGVYKRNNTVFPSAANYYNTYVWNRNNCEENTFSTSFFKMKEVRLDYSLPAKVCRQTKFLTNASLGVYATNLFCLTDFPQYDPETAMVNDADIHAGIETMSFPMTRTYGINVKFSF